VVVQVVLVALLLRTQVKLVVKAVPLYTFKRQFVYRITTSSLVAVVAVVAVASTEFKTHTQKVIHTTTAGTPVVVAVALDTVMVLEAVVNLRLDLMVLMATETAATVPHLKQ
jgi:hypothetical protein